MVGILKAVKSDQSTENNTRAFSILLLLPAECGVSRMCFFVASLLIKFTVLCSIPWFIFEKRRPGLKIPPNTNLMTIGVKQVYVAFRECMKLKQTFLYLVFYFLMSVPHSWVDVFYLTQLHRGDVLNTTVWVHFELQKLPALIDPHSTVIATLQNRHVQSETHGRCIWRFWSIALSLIPHWTLHISSLSAWQLRESGYSGCSLPYFSWSHFIFV